MQRRAAGSPWLVWCWLLLVPALNWPATSLPFERDEGEYALAATIAAQGGVPYRDTFLQKPPGIILAYRAILAVSDGSPRAVHVALLVIYTLTAAGIGAIALRLSGRVPVAAVAIILYGMSLATPLYKASAANTEAFMVAAIVAAVYALLRARESRSLGWVIALGAALGVAGMMKQTAASHVIWLLPALAFAAPKPRGRWRWPLVASVSGSVVIGLVCLPYFVAGAGRELMDAVVLHNFEYARGQLERAFRERAHVRGLDIASFHVALWLAAAIGLAVIARKRQWWTLTVLGAWLLTGWIGASIGAVYRGHYLLQLLPPVVILAAWILVESPRRIQVVAAPITVIYWLFSGGLQWTASEGTLADQRYHTTRFANAELVGRWLREQSDHSVYVFGSEPEIYYYSGAMPVTRYVIQNPLFGGFASSAARQREAWVSVARARPVPFFAGSDPWFKAQLERLLASEYRPSMTAAENHVGLSPTDRLPTRAAPQMTIWERVHSPAVER